MTYKQFINIYGNVCPLQKFNQLIAALPQQWKREIRKGNGQELVCRPHIKNYNWLKKRTINREMYTFYLRSKTLTATPYKILDSWEYMLDLPIAWQQVFNLTYKTTIDSSIRFFQFKLLYKLCLGGLIINENVQCKR
uniref:Uncharacterized protein n=1 Tax=Anguilla anguilla TaxID=7936 RepID=A0A0E9V7V2_ANGAN